jgi:hypothetical protein
VAAPGLDFGDRSDRTIDVSTRIRRIEQPSRRHAGRRMPTWSWPNRASSEYHSAFSLENRKPFRYSVVATKKATQEGAQTPC